VFKCVASTGYWGVLQSVVVQICVLKCVASTGYWGVLQCVVVQICVLKCVASTGYWSVLQSVLLRLCHSLLNHGLLKSRFCQNSDLEKFHKREETLKYSLI